MRQALRDRFGDWRTIVGLIGVSALTIQLLRLSGYFLELVGLAAVIVEFFDDLLPQFTLVVNIALGLDLTGLDILAVTCAIAATLIVLSSISYKNAMKTWYIFRFFLIPYALIIIILSIVIQSAAPFYEFVSFTEACEAGDSDAEQFYGSSCEELEAIGGAFNGAEDTGGMPRDVMIIAVVSVYMALILPLAAAGIFFFKRLNINRLVVRNLSAIATALLIVSLSQIASGEFNPANWLKH